MGGRNRAAALLVAAMTTAAHATVLLQQTPRELLAQADLVVLGVVESQRSVRAQGELMTESTVRVEETLRGVPVRSLVLSQLGGREGNIVADVPGNARLQAGDRVVLITYRHRDGRRYLVGMGLGAYHVQDGGKLQQNVDVPLVSRDGTLQSGPHAVVTTLEQFRQWARSVQP